MKTCNDIACKVAVAITEGLGRKEAKALTAELAADYARRTGESAEAAKRKVWSMLKQNIEIMEMLS